MSLPSRGAWIEIRPREGPEKDDYVAPLTGSVDRNLLLALAAEDDLVAPLTGSVDRNVYQGTDIA